MSEMSRDAGDVGITLDDLETVSEAVMLRFPLRHAESHRIERMRELLDAASELNRALTQHTQHAVVHCRGSHGTGDLVADAGVLFDALATFGMVVRDVAAEYRSTVRDPVTPPVEAPVGLTPMSLNATSPR
ncbi:MAG TPA: hypothetical protein VKA84_21740 [Gemmatimonadaceae bacterium]|nr:hypothetical protein [Gemmatimonadaceae bacterium]